LKKNMKRRKVLRIGGKYGGKRAAVRPSGGVFSKEKGTYTLPPEKNSGRLGSGEKRLKDLL